MDVSHVVDSSAMASVEGQMYLTDIEVATLVHAEEDFSDLDGSADDEEDVIISDQDDYSYPCGAIVSTDTYVWENMIIYNG
jgi:hypothetical protein